MIFKQFTINDAEYQLSLVLRESVLRAPLGLTLSEQDIKNEEQQFHFGLFDKHQIQAVVLLKPISGKTLKLRQMAVSDTKQGQGLGKQLIKQAEAVVHSLGYKQIEMAARESAIAFYQSLDYQAIDEPFKEVGITHIKMAKVL